MKTLSIATILLALCLANAINQKPVIGVLSFPSGLPDYPSNKYSHIPASYVKLIESTGSRVVPIPYDASPENITFLLQQVNGVFFIGGDAMLTAEDSTGKLGPSSLTQTGRQILTHVIESNQKGENFPLMAVCEGWEMLLMAMSQVYDGLLYKKYKEFNVKASVQFLKEGDQYSSNTSKIWSHLPEYLWEYAEKNEAFAFDHRNGIVEDAFRNNKFLNNTMKITTISDPKNGGPQFVASAEGINYPIFGSQFHPERVAYEWEVNAPHSPDAVLISQHYANAFVDEARKNNRTFKSNDTLKNSLIYNWKPTANSETFSQVYTFPLVAQNQAAWRGLFNVSSTNGGSTSNTTNTSGMSVGNETNSTSKNAMIQTPVALIMGVLLLFTFLF